MMINVKVSKLWDTATIPTKAHPEDAGFDLYADERAFRLDAEEGKEYINEIPPHETKMIHTAIALEIPTGYFGAIYARSGLGKKGLRPANCVGVIDSNYRGEIIVAMHNDTDKPMIIKDKDRVAQLVIQPIPMVNLIETDSLNESDRGTNGFGSSGN